MKLTHKEQKAIYKWVLDQDINLEYGKLSLCDLKNYRHSSVYQDRRYQVHCDDPKCQHSMIYDNKESAVEKFIELKNKAKRIK